MTKFLGGSGHDYLYNWVTYVVGHPLRRVLPINLTGVHKLNDGITIA